jgi:ribosomal protein S18 acetylase RimI-like enzyme
MLPVVSPGRTMLLLSPPHLEGGFTEHLMKRLIDAACAAGAHKGIHLAQALVDPHEETLQRAYRSCAFILMAELIYLQADVRPHISGPTLPARYTWETYSERTHALFAQAVHITYQDSLDCPALNGMREMEDVILGHKASGDFDPNLWFLLCRDGKPLGVLLLAVSSRNDLVELVYLGLAVEARGKKLGEVLMRQALAVTAQQKRERLTLAVDARNVPALKLYYRQGMSRIATKYALMKDLRGRTQG